MPMTWCDAPHGSTVSVLGMRIVRYSRTVCDNEQNHQTQFGKKNIYRNVENMWCVFIREEYVVQLNGVQMDPIYLNYFRWDKTSSTILHSVIPSSPHTPYLTTNCWPENYVRIKIGWNVRHVASVQIFAVQMKWPQCTWLPWRPMML